MRIVALSLMIGVAALAADTSTNVTFNKDVVPILQKNCQTCHRPGEIGPMPLLTYEGTRPWAKAIKAAVLTRKMPPWDADPKYGHFANDRRLADADINKLVAWVDANAPEGDPKDKPAPVDWGNDGWNIKPDLVFEMPKSYTVPKTGTIQYTYFVIPGGFTKDTWVTDAEIRPGNRAVVHHVSVYIRPPGSPWMQDAKPGEAYVPARRGTPGVSPPVGNASRVNTGQASEWFAGYVPGIQPQRYFAPERDSAKLIPAGSDIVFEMHYTANGKDSGDDRSKVGFVLAKEPPKYRLLTIAVADASFAIPPGDPNYEGHASLTFDQPVTVLYLQPHMHLRGKDMEVRFEYPAGESETVLNVPHYSYLWQTIYFEKEPLAVPKGTTVRVTAHWDNSANNPLNPDPTATVRWGDQSWDEMLAPLVGVLVDRDTDSSKVTQRGPFLVFNGGPYVAAVHANGRPIGPPTLYPGATPAKPGEIVVLYGGGAATQSGTLSPLPVIQIGGVPATVQFVGLVAPGEFQFNVAIPMSLANGDQSITAAYAGVSSQSGALITIHN